MGIIKKERSRWGAGCRATTRAIVPVQDRAGMAFRDATKGKRQPKLP